MQLPIRFADIPTTRLCWAALALLIVGRLLDAITGPLWVHFGLHATALEYIGGGLFILGYGSLWALLPVSAFRPGNRFYLQGDCFLRVKRFAFVLGLLVFVHIWAVVAMAIFLRSFAR